MNLNTIRVWWSTWQKVPKEKNRRRPTSPAGRGHPCHFLIRVSIFCPNPASTRFTRGLTNITHRLKETSTTDQQRPDRRNNLQRRSPVERCHVAGSTNGRRKMRSQSDLRVRERECIKRGGGAIWITAFGGTKPSLPKNPNPWRLRDPLCSLFSLSSFFFLFPSLLRSF